MVHLLNAIAVAAAFVPAALATDSTTLQKHASYYGNSTSAIASSTAAESATAVTSAMSTSTTDDFCEEDTSSSAPDELSTLSTLTKTTTVSIGTVTSCEPSSATCEVGKAASQVVTVTVAKSITISASIISTLKIECYGGVCVNQCKDCNAAGVYFRVVCDINCRIEACSYEERNLRIDYSPKDNLYHYVDRNSSASANETIVCTIDKCDNLPRKAKKEEVVDCPPEKSPKELPLQPMEKGVKPLVKPSPVSTEPSSKPVPQPNGPQGKSSYQPKGPEDKPAVPRAPGGESVPSRPAPSGPSYQPPPAPAPVPGLKSSPPNPGPKKADTPQLTSSSSRTTVAVQLLAVAFSLLL